MMDVKSKAKAEITCKALIIALVMAWVFVGCRTTYRNTELELPDGASQSPGTLTYFAPLVADTPGLVVTLTGSEDSEFRRLLSHAKTELSPHSDSPPGELRYILTMFGHENRMFEFYFEKDGSVLNLRGLSKRERAELQEQFSKAVGRLISLRLKALQGRPKLVLPVRPPTYWVERANNTSLAPIDRRKAVAQLFFQHSHPGMSIGEVAALLRGGTWMSESDIGKRPYASTGPSFVMRPNTVIYGFDILPTGGPDGGYLVSFQVEGDFSREAVAGALLGKSERGDSAIMNAKIIDFVIGDGYHGQREDTW